MSIQERAQKKSQNREGNANKIQLLTLVVSLMTRVIGKDIAERPPNCHFNSENQLYS